MNPRKEKRLARQIARACRRKEKRLGHTLSKEEVLALKVQTLSPYLRIASGALGVASIFAALYGFGNDNPVMATFWVVAFIVFFLFAVFGIRKTLAELTDDINPLNLANLIGDAVKEGASRAVEAVFDEIGS